MSSARWPYGNFASMSPEFVARWARSALNLPQLLIVDTETTGHGPPWDDETAEIVELCIIDHTGAVLLNTLVKPHGQMHPTAAAKTGISQVQLAESPAFSTIADQVIRLLQGRSVVIYNAEFDNKLLHEEFERCGRATPIYEIRCAMLAYHAFRRRRNSDRWVGLAKACSEEGITLTHAHRALGDCQATLALLRHMATYAPNNRAK